MIKLIKRDAFKDWIIQIQMRQNSNYIVADRDCFKVSRSRKICDQGRSMDVGPRLTTIRVKSGYNQGIIRPKSGIIRLYPD